MKKVLVLLVVVFILGFTINVNATTEKESQEIEVAKNQLILAIDANNFFIRTITYSQNDQKTEIVRVLKKYYIKACEEVGNPYDPMYLLFANVVVSANNWKEDHIDKDLIESIELVNKVFIEVIAELDKSVDKTKI